jgi:ribose transport system substrate-binding protein
MKNIVTLRRRYSYMAVVLSGALTAGVLLAACGTASAGSRGGANVKAAKAIVAEYMAPLKFTSPGPAFDARKAAGQKLFVLPASSEVPFVVNLDNAMAGIAKDAGISAINYPNKQQVSQWIQGMNLATAEHVNDIALVSGVQPQQLVPQIKAAKKSGITSWDINNSDASQSVPSYVKRVNGLYADQGKVLAAWPVSKLGGKANILFITSKVDTSSQADSKEFGIEMAKLCPSCKVQYINENPNNWATQITPTVEAALTANPQINYVETVYDGQAGYVVPALVASHKTASVHIATVNGTPSVLNQMRTGSSITMDLGVDPAEFAAASLDQIMRSMLGLPAGNEVVGLHIFDKANVGQAGVPAVVSKGYGTSWAKGYSKLWGVKISALVGNSKK